MVTVTAYHIKTYSIVTAYHVLRLRPMPYGTTKSVYGSVVPRNIRRGATLRPLPGESNVEHIIRIGTAATDTACFSLRTPSTSIRVPSSVPARFEAAFTSDRYDFLCQRNKLSMGYINNRIARTTYISRRVYILT